MKLATLRDGSRDGALVVVSQDNQRFLPASAVAPHLQSALDDWDNHYQSLNALYDQLNGSSNIGSPFTYEQSLSPLPRAYEWVDGSAYINHILLVRKARGAEPPPTLRTEPLVYQGGSGIFLDPQGNIPLADESWGCDFESEVCVILGDTPQGTKKEDAHKYIKLILIANDVSLRNLIPGELQKGFGFFNSKPATAFSPIAVTPDELGNDWSDGRVHLPLITNLNGEKFGEPNAGCEMHFSFYDLIEHITKTRSFTAGTILGSGTVSNEDQSVGSSCLAEKRTIEKIASGEISTSFLKHGDSISIEMLNRDGSSIFGSINQTVTPLR